jgi:hypothetical protein
MCIHRRDQNGLDHVYLPAPYASKRRTGLPIAFAGILTIIGGIFLSAYGNHLKENTMKKISNDENTEANDTESDAYDNYRNLKRSEH